MASTSATLGKYVVGLQPDDRTPHDWLRMVARVFAAYRERPLEKSIVAHVDGLTVQEEEFTYPNLTLKITPGQCFIDDQFIGFEEDSFISIDLSFLQDNLENNYYIVLQYQWINAYPPSKPHIYFKEKVFIDEEQELPLACVIRRGNSYELIDVKKPWYQAMFDQMIGDTEIDTSEKLPFVAYINAPYSENSNINYETSREGTMDIGWALDFHRVLGNNVDYDARLHLDVTQDSPSLYINNEKILTKSENVDEYGNTYNYITIDNRVFNEVEENKSCVELTIVDADGLNERGASICKNYEENSIHIKNYYYVSDADPKHIINDIQITDIEDVVTINGYRIWHEGNINKTGKSIYYFGELNTPPLFRHDGTPVQNGDVYFDIDAKGYIFYREGQWIPFGVNLVKTCVYQPTADTDTIPCLHKTDMPVMVWIGGILLSPDNYDAISDEQVIKLNGILLQKDETAQVLSYWDGGEITASLNYSFTAKTPQEKIIGEIIEYAGDNVPEGFIECDGSSLNKKEYPELFKAIGDRYGKETKETFKLPLVKPNPFKKYIRYK